VASLLLKIHHLACKLTGAPFHAITHLTDRIILAVHAPQVAIGEKDRARPFGTGDRRFFAMVRTYARYDRIQPGPAETRFLVYQTICAAFAGANTAAFEKHIRRFDTFI
jgi:hypothetical protein